MPQIRLNAALDVSAPPRVDRAARRINGVAVMTIGPALGHGFRLNEVSLANALQLGTAAPKGIKSRLSHPNACNDTTGKHLGRAINFRQDGNKLLADLQLAAASTKSPHGNLADYVMTLAEEDPEAFGNSMVVEYQTETELDEKKQPKRDANGDPLPPFAIITALKAVDVVGDPAANPGGMFSEGDDTDFAKDASALLDSLEAGSPEALLSRAEVFLRAYLSHRFGDVPDSLFSKGTSPMTKEQQDRRDAIATLCTKYLGETDGKTFAATLTADEKITAANAHEPLLAELSRRAEKPAAPPPNGELAAYLERRTQITALCVSALGDSLETVKRVEAYLADSNVTVESVRNAMFGEMAARLKAPAAGDDPLKASDKDAKRKAELEAEYDSQATTHAALGVSKADYVAAALAGDGPCVIVPQANSKS